jgi:hypothetical protein
MRIVVNSPEPVQSRLTNLPGSSEITLLQRFYEDKTIFGGGSGWNFLEGDDFEHALVNSR